MRVVYSWLKEFIEFKEEISASEAARVLTAAGLEVEDHQKLGEGVSGVVVAQVVSKAKHPNADKLTLVQVRTEESGPTTQVVCGAANVPEPGGLVLWAKPGATLPSGMTLGSKDLKGEASAGMLCAEDELGLGDSHDGIVVLSEADGAPLGSDIRQSLSLEDDVFDLAVPANRADVLGHYGVARELAALTQSRLVYPKPGATKKTPLGGLSVDLKDSRCSRYVARRVEGLKVGPSPLWMQQRLRAVGVRPVSNLVDVTNYVMFELGQPLHAFDGQKLKEGGIVVRSSRAGESLKTLDGEVRECQEGDLLICDGETPVAVAGVMGGESTEVGDETTVVVLESAHFEPKSVRRSAKRMGLHSESSHRFERYVDPNGCELASIRAASLLAQLGGGRVVEGASDIYPKPLGARQVTMRVSRAKALTGVDVAGKRAAEILDSLGLQTTLCSGDVVDVCIPTFRSDLNREVDLIEEVIRVYGFDRVAATLPTKTVAPTQVQDSRPRLAAQAMMASGYSESITFGFTSPSKLSALRFSNDDPRLNPIVIDNPLSIEQSVMRTSLLPNLLAAAANNIKHGNADVALFELGAVFLRSQGGELPTENQHLAAVLGGRRGGRYAAGEFVDVFDLKGALELTLRRSVDGSKVSFRPAAEEPWLHGGVGASIWLDEVKIGFIGEVHPDVRDQFDLGDALFAFELDFSKVPTLNPKTMRTVARFPAVVRDISMLMDVAIPAASVVQAIDSTDEKLLVDATVLDDYRDPAHVPLGQKGMLWSLTYRSDERTLTDKEVDKAHGSIEKKVLESLGAVRR